ncbi:16S rRNA (cytosine(1402)-N(4))-methyltransferase RsmH [Treponema sp.]|uniref:16S rRNA (cytosine(1402)-N(4))-methyltransferase RsmH n=1 Tax=Treponema sp. TaxID=166 RepID=UPI003FA1B713
MEFVHTPVLLQECLQFLVPELPNPLLIDGTLGEGGHTEAFLRSFPQLRAIGIDADPAIQEKAKVRLTPFGERVRFFLGWSHDFFAAYPQHEAAPALILFDLGISLFHYKESGRGFSFSTDEPLDMRINPTESLTAADIVNTYPEKKLADMLYVFAEERFSRVIARVIVAERQKAPFTTARQLAEAVFSAVPARFRHGAVHPATKTFQALRIAVNSELDRLPSLLENAFACLAEGGKMGVISFHSLEDRIVKCFFRDLAKACICPPEVPICRCGGVPRAELLTKKPVAPSDEEVAVNAPSRSARLRVIKKCPMRRS